MRIQRYLALGLAWLSLASCLGVSFARAGDRNPNALAATDPLGNINRLPAALEQTVGLQRTRDERFRRRARLLDAILNPVTIVFDGRNRPMAR